MTGSIVFAKGKKVHHRADDIALATLRTDDAGRLIVVGGPGTSKSPAKTKLGSFADNDGWYDSVSDGPVSATLRIGKTSHPVIPAWVTVTCRATRPGCGIVTWFDQALNMARTSEDGTFDPPRTTSFLHDVYPILKRADARAAVHFTAHGRGSPPHPERLRRSCGPGRTKGLLTGSATNTAADDIEKVPPGRCPCSTAAQIRIPRPKCPCRSRLSVRSPSALGLGDFVNDWPGAEPKPAPFEKIPVARQPHGLNEAALEACVGGPFFPVSKATTSHESAHATPSALH
jgi:hypothetical protein